MITWNYFTLPFQIPRICYLFSNWPEYLFNYVLRIRKPAEYRLRSGFRLIDGTGTLAGTLAQVFVRKQYGSVERSRVIVDIGANIGGFAVYAAQSCQDAQIYCYEPEQRNFDLLKRNIAINRLEGRVSAFNCAVASSRGQRRLAVGESPLNSFHTLPEGASRQAVKCTTMRNILEDHGLEAIDVLKMNCEGAEYEILEGCSESDFERIASIRLEYHILDSPGRNGKSLSRLLEARGYKIERFTQRLKESGFIWATRVNVNRKKDVTASLPC
jgi:FkbM family methyltransferase